MSLGQLEVAVFLHSQISNEERWKVLAAIRSLPDASDLMHVSYEDAYAEFIQMLNGALVPVSPGDLPESFRFIVSDARDYSAIRSALRRLPGVHAVECRPMGPQS
ncbi:MAG TPA: hypothetical protein DGG94_00910 [Micromonosporaceae bacterium]|nr:hypothetical protein [Micromonosporaceae bacterium]HCU48391.1 hypothetical protein [Micromonosporaceae bacterium]